MGQVGFQLGYILTSIVFLVSKENMQQIRRWMEDGFLGSSSQLSPGAIDQFELHPNQSPVFAAFTAGKLMFSLVNLHYHEIIQVTRRLLAG